MLRERKHGYDMSAAAVGYSTLRKRRDDEVIARLEENFTVQHEAKPQFDKRMYAVYFGMGSAANFLQIFREDYIEQQLRLRKEKIARSVGSAAADEAGALGTPKTLEELEADNPLRVPVQIDPIVASSSSLSANDNDGGRQRNGPRWATTVVEVELPSSYRMQAIKETEKMLQKIQAESSKPSVLALFFGFCMCLS